MVFGATLLKPHADHVAWAWHAGQANVAPPAKSLRETLNADAARALLLHGPFVRRPPNGNPGFAIMPARAYIPRFLNMGNTVNAQHALV